MESAVKRLERLVLGSPLERLHIGGARLGEKMSPSEVNALALVGIAVEEGRYFSLRGIEPVMRADLTAFYSVCSEYARDGLMLSSAVVGVVNAKRTVEKFGISVLTEAVAGDVLSRLGHPAGECRSAFGELRLTSELNGFGHEPPLWVKRVFTGTDGYVAVSLQYRLRMPVQETQQQVQG